MVCTLHLNVKIGPSLLGLSKAGAQGSAAQLEIRFIPVSAETLYGYFRRN